MTAIKWIKITTDIFDDEKIQLIESMPDSYAIIVCWFKLLCFAGKQNTGGIMMLNDRIAYTDEMLATIFRMNLNTVKLALGVFENFGMIVVADDVIKIKNWEKYQSMKDKQTYNEYMREYMNKRNREKRLALAEQQEKLEGESDDEDHLKKFNKNLIKFNSEEIRNKNKEIRNKNKDNNNRRFTPPTLEDVKAYCRQRNNNVDPQKFFDYYSEGDWHDGEGKQVKNWKQKLLTWEQKDNAKPVKPNPSKIMNERDIKDDQYANWFSAELKHKKG